VITFWLVKEKNDESPAGKIGNSQGVRIPKPLLDQTGIGEDVELEVSESQIILRPISNPRPGWESAFKTMAKEA
jgi:antitoxin MazE